jgi:hypothetical protein
VNLTKRRWEKTQISKMRYEKGILQNMPMKFRSWCNILIPYIFLNKLENLKDG